MKESSLFGPIIVKCSICYGWRTIMYLKKDFKKEEIDCWNCNKIGLDAMPLSEVFEKEEINIWTT